MDDLTINYREVLSKDPWWRVVPRGYMKHGIGETRDDSNYTNMQEDHLYRIPLTQADFLREYYPSAHSIFDEVKYPDIYKHDPDTDKWYKQPITRVSFAFQQVIATKHILHLTGNDMQFEIADGAVDDAKEEEYQHNLIKFRKCWLLSGMEVRTFEAVRSLMITGDTAIVGYFNKNKFGAKTLSYLNGDTLYPHVDSITGELELFARRYYDYDEDGIEKTEYVEVWDNENIYRYKRGVNEKGFSALLKKIFNLDGFELISTKKHGFSFLPVAYFRNNDGPCWHSVQKNIEDYEEAFSYLCENNKAFAFPIMYMKGSGDDIKVVGDTDGAAKLIQMADKDDDAGFLNGTDASNAFATQLDKSYELIYELSFTVKPPELKSGDLPGVALKLLYSPALEAAMNDAQMLQPFVDKLVKMVKFGVGFEENQTATYMDLPINAWISPYIHSNSTEIITNLATAVQNKFISRQTASERCPDFPKNDEYARIIAEEKEKQQMDLLTQLEVQDHQTENAIEQEEATARINHGKGGSDINQPKGGKKGRPNRSGKEWDKNGNFLGESNWDSYNKKQ